MEEVGVDGLKMRGGGEWRRCERGDAGERRARGEGRVEIGERS